MTRPPINWRDGSLYPVHLSPRRMAWEFLRRNADYRSEWQRLRRFARGRPAAEVREVERGVAAAFGIERMADPRQDDPPRFTVACDRVVHAGPDAACLRSDDCAQVAIVLDARLPIAAQLETLRHWAPAWAVAWRRRHGVAPLRRIPDAHRLVDALRAWDARVGGALLEEIGDVLYSPTRGGDYGGGGARRFVHRLLELADDLTAGGYRDIAMHETYRPPRPADEQGTPPCSGVDFVFDEVENCAMGVPISNR